MPTRLFPTLVVATAVAAFPWLQPIRAAELKDMTISVIGLPSMVNGWKHVQQPFFDKNMPEASGGKVKFDAKPHDQAGIDIKETTRLASDGVINIGYGAFAVHAGDDARLEGIDLPGIGLTPQEARTAVESYRPVAEKVLRDKFKLKLLTVQPNTMQVVFCKGGIQSLDDFKGKKVRVFGTAMADYMKELGAVTINIPFVEVLPAMQQGVADCGITSPANGNGARWWEVTRDLLIMPVGGWGLGFFAANMDWWNSLTPDAQAFLQAEFKKLEDRQWQQAAFDLTDGVNCNTGEGTCEFGIKAEAGKQMKAIRPTDADKARHTQVMASSVLKNWAKRCGSACVKEWNGSIGKTVGIEAPAP
jgi:TRAP-type transport system periplasmic protein